MNRKKYIICEAVNDSYILVNNKEVRKDMNGNWIGQDLNLKESEYFRKFVATLSKSDLKLQKATYVIK